MSEPTPAELVAGSPRLRRRQQLARAMTRVLARVEVDGLARIPATGPLILALNHRSMCDGLLAFGLLPRPICCLVKAEAFVPVVGAVLRGAGQLPVVRGRVDRAPIRACLRLLRAGGVVGVFPEGTRGDGAVRTAKPGVGYLALRSGATVLPVACHGTEQVARRRHWARPPVRLSVGAPIPVARYPDHRILHRDLVAELTERIRVELAGLVDATRGSRSGRASTMVS